MTDELDLTRDPAAEGGDAGETMPIEGILAESIDTGTVRLYLDLAFETYYEIPRDAILRRERVPAERSPLGVDSWLLLVRRGTSLVVHRMSKRAVEQEFLAGDFTAPGSFRTGSALFTRRRTEPMHIPSYTVFGHICCNPPFNGATRTRAPRTHAGLGPRAEVPAH